MCLTRREGTAVPMHNVNIWEEGKKDDKCNGELLHNNIEPDWE